MRCVWLVLVVGAVGLINCDKQDIEGRIIRGSKARYRQWPMYVQLSIILVALGETKEFIGCSGTIISKRHILTTAVCVAAERRSVLKNAIFHVYAGNPKVFFDTFLYAEQKIRVKTIISHPVFNLKKKWGQENDIAIVVLEQPLEWTPNVQPAKLANEHVSTMYNHECYQSGFGVKRFKREPDFSVTRRVYPDALWTTKVTVAPNFVCKYFFQHSIYYKNVLDDSQLCAATLKGNNACMGDGAAPIMCPDDKGEFRLVGMTSYGMGGYYCVMGISANTRVEYYKEWIAEQLA